MNSVTVVFLDGSSKTFTAPGILAVAEEQFWFRVTNESQQALVSVPREQIKYFTTNLCTIQ